MPSRDTRLFERTLSERKDRYEGAEIRSIFETSGSGVPQYVNGTMVFLVDDDDGEEDEIDYDSVTLRSQTLERSAALETVEEIQEQGRSQRMMYVGDHVFSTNPRHVLGPRSGWPAPLGRRERLSGWPERIFEFEAENGGNLSSLPLTKPNRPPLVSSDSVHHHWLPGDLPGDTETRSCFYVVCPDYRIALESIEVTGEDITVHTKRHSEFDGEVLIQIAGPNPKGLERTQNLTTEEFYTPLENLPDELYVFLIEKRSEDVMDWAEVDPHSLSQPPMIHTEVPPEDARDHIAAAENQTVELKGGIPGHDVNVRDLVETMVGFSNAQGGRIYIGVNDDKNIRGVDDEEKTIERAESWAHDRVEPGVPVETGTVHLEGERVVVVKVPEGDNKPYRSLADDAFFIRVGEDDERMTRSQMDQIYKERNAGNLPLGIYQR